MRPEISDVPLLVTTSWDDGHPSDFRVADLLERHGLQGTFYVPCRNSEGRPVMQPTEIAQLGRRFEIGGHTYDHVSLTKIAPHLAAAQILANKYWLEDLLGRQLHGFAYVRGHHNHIIRSLVAKAGYSYARTVKNLMSTPGSNILEVSTTIQFFAHSRATYIRNYVSGRPTLERSAVLAAVLGNTGLATRLSTAAEVCSRTGGYFHVWGHSWELDQHGLWGELDCLLGQLRHLNARFMTNDVWCENLSTRAVAQTLVAAGTQMDPLSRPRESRRPPSRCVP
jgi:peptidoglycan/xylan/chitin deacetylase (PgdA/CDA1 family)